MPAAPTADDHTHLAAATQGGLINELRDGGVVGTSAARIFLAGAVPNGAAYIDFPSAFTLRRPTGVNLWQVQNADGHLRVGTHNTQDIATAATRVRKLYAVDADLTALLIDVTHATPFQLREHPTLPNVMLLGHGGVVQGSAFASGFVMAGSSLVNPWGGYIGMRRSNSNVAHYLQPYNQDLVLYGYDEVLDAYPASLADHPGLVLFDKGADAATPQAGTLVIYVKNDALYVRNDAGTVVGPLAANAVPTHEAAGDPHTGYLQESVISALATPAIVLGSAAAAGSGTTPIRHNATIAAFDATNPASQVPGDAAVVGTAAFAARRDHKHAMGIVGVQAKRVASTALTTSDTLLTLTEADDWDTDGFHDPVTNSSRLTVPAGLGGLYHVVGRYRCNLASAGSAHLALGLNNPAAIAIAAAHKGIGGVFPTAGNNTYIQITGYVVLVPGDYLTLSGRLSTSQSITDLYFTMERVGP
jgi:hypothetical protein